MAMGCTAPPLQNCTGWSSCGSLNSCPGTKNRTCRRDDMFRYADNVTRRNYGVCANSRQSSKGDAPGEYGGPPVDMRIRKSWGTNEPDPLTNPDSYIWNKKWKETLDYEERQEAEAAELEEERKRKAKDGGSGFLSLGRSLALDSLDVDLSAELSQPSAATLARQVAQVRQGEMRRQLEEESIKWRVSPTRGEEKQWATANRYIGERGIAEGGKQSLDPVATAMEAEEKFQKLKSDLFLYTLGVGGGCLVGAYATYTPEVALSYSVGLLGALAYIRMLSNSVEAIGSASVASAALGAAGQPRLFVPVVLVLVFNRWNGLFAPDHDLPLLQLIPMLIGFFTYKAATLLQTFADVIQPMAPKKME